VPSACPIITSLSVTGSESRARRRVALRGDHTRMPFAHREPENVCIFKLVISVPLACQAFEVSDDQRRSSGPSVPEDASEESGGAGLGKLMVSRAA
jgi:hypothetical protein